MNDTLLKSYNRSFNGGKSRFARICDNVFSALLLTAALYLLVSRKLHHGAASLFAAMLISASILLTASLLRSLRFNAHIKNSAEKHPSRFCGAGYSFRPKWTK